MLLQDSFQISKIGSFCWAQVEYFLAIDMLDGAESWINMWEDVETNNPQIEKLALKDSDV